MNIKSFFSKKEKTPEMKRAENFFAFSFMFCFSSLVFKAESEFISKIVSNYGFNGFSSIGLLKELQIIFMIQTLIGALLLLISGSKIKKLQEVKGTKKNEL